MKNFGYAVHRLTFHKCENKEKNVGLEQTFINGSKLFKNTCGHAVHRLAMDFI